MTEFKKSLEAKGWTLKELCDRWGIKDRQMYNVAKTPRRRDWDAVAGLPNRKGPPRPSDFRFWKF